MLPWVSGLGTPEQTGDSSTALRMTCVPIGIVEMYLSFVCLYCYAEEAGVKVGQTFLSARIARPIA